MFAPHGEVRVEMVSPIERGGGSLRGMEGRRKEENLMRSREEERVQGARDQKATLRVCFQGGGERICGGGGVSCNDSVTLQVLEEHGEIYR